MVYFTAPVLFEYRGFFMRKFYRKMFSTNTQEKIAGAIERLACMILLAIALVIRYV